MLFPFLLFLLLLLLPFDLFRQRSARSGLDGRAGAAASCYTVYSIRFRKRWSHFGFLGFDCHVGCRFRGVLLGCFICQLCCWLLLRLPLDAGRSVGSGGVPTLAL